MRFIAVLPPGPALPPTSPSRITDNVLSANGRAARRQLGVAPSALCPEYAQLVKALDEALKPYKEAEERVRKMTSDHPHFVEATKAVARALAELRSQFNALKEHILQHDC
jgi:hypothetical protein